MSLTTPRVDKDVVVADARKRGGGGEGGGEGGGGGGAELSPLKEAEESIDVKVDPPVRRFHCCRPKETNIRQILGIRQISDKY